MAQDPIDENDKPPVNEGDILAGKYKVEKVLGAGAMGVVVAALHIHLDERVALKFLRPEMAENKEVVARFLREAQSAVRIKGEHVARVSDVGTLESGAPYMVMEHLVGQDLGVMLEKEGRLSVDVAVDFMIQACEAVAEAHALGIVHRDLKPANMFVTTRGDGSPLVKVLDFGIAKLLNDTSKAQLTAMGAVMGSPMYMSPEQLMNSKAVDQRSDIWQLGAILYEAVSGKPAFDGNTMSEIMIAIGVNPPPKLLEARPDAPPELEALILKCLEKELPKRLPDVAAFAEGLLPFATTRRAHVSVEHIVTVMRGASAAANLPAMRAPMRSGASLLESASEGRIAAREPSNAYAETAVAGAPGLAAASASMPTAAALSASAIQANAQSTAHDKAAETVLTSGAHASGGVPKGVLIAGSATLVSIAMVAAAFAFRASDPGPAAAAQAPSAHAAAADAGAPRVAPPAPK